MDKTDHLMAEKNENNKDSQKGQVTIKKYLKKDVIVVSTLRCVPVLHFLKVEQLYNFKPLCCCIGIKRKKREIVKCEVRVRERECVRVCKNKIVCVSKIVRVKQSE